MQPIEVLTEKCIQLSRVLNLNKEILLHDYSCEVGYSNNDINLLWNDLIGFLDNFPDLYRMTYQDIEEKRFFYNKWEKGSEFLSIPWGKVLVCSPSNSVIPLLPIFILSFCSTGNSLILAPSRKAEKTANAIFNLVREVFSELHWDFSLFSNGGIAALQEFVDGNVVDLLYFQGSSKNRDSIYNQCLRSGVDLIFEGEGNQISIIDDVEINAISSVSKMLYLAKNMCSGQLCTTPNTLFIKHCLKDAFCKFYNSIGGRISVIDFRDIELLKNIVNSEMFSTTLQLVSYQDIDEVISFLKKYYCYGLQISLFSQSPASLKAKIISNLHVSRITINMNPTYQNALLPWGGYKKAGFSNVLNFVQKGLKNIIIETRYE